MNNKVKYIIYIVLFAIAIGLPFLMPTPYQVYTLIAMGINIIMALSLRLIMKFGEVSFGHAAFMGIGGYMSAVVTTYYGWSFWVALPVAAIMAALIALPIGYIVLRLKGAYFFIITLAFGSAVQLVFNSVEYLGGSSGIPNIPKPELFGLSFQSPVNYYFIVLFFVLLTIVVMRSLDISRIGMVLGAIADNQDVSESVGANTTGYKVIAFVIACFFAGIAGSLFAHFYLLVHPDLFGIHQSLNILTYTVVGGVGNVWGPVIGAGILSLIPEFLRNIPGLEPIVFGCILIVCLRVLPNGLIGVYDYVVNALKNRKTANA